METSLRAGSQLQSEAQPHYWEPDRHSSTEAYARRFAGPVGEYFLRVQREAVLNSLQSISKLKLAKSINSVLEIGGGHLQLTNAYRTVGARVTIHGSCEESLLRAKAAYGSTEAVDFLIGPAEKLPLVDCSVDIVSAFRIIPHTKDPQALLAEMMRIARVGIIFDFASTRSLNVLTPLLFRLKLQIEKDTRPFFRTSPRQIKQILEAHGFVPIFAYPQFMLPMGLIRTFRLIQVVAAIESVSRIMGLTRLFGSPVIVGAVRRTPL